METVAWAARVAGTQAVAPTAVVATGVEAKAPEVEEAAARALVVQTAGAMGSVVWEAKTVVMVVVETAAAPTAVAVMVAAVAWVAAAAAASGASLWAPWVEAAVAGAAGAWWQRR